MITIKANMSVNILVPIKPPYELFETTVPYFIYLRKVIIGILKCNLFLYTYLINKVPINLLKYVLKHKFPKNKNNIPNF